MSTCQGAPPPHRDCPHGDRCDYVPAALARTVATPTGAVILDSAALERRRDTQRPVPNRAERRAAARGRTR